MSLIVRVAPIYRQGGIGRTKLYMAKYRSSIGGGLRGIVPMTRVRNDLFNASDGYKRGRGLFVFGAWQLIKWAFFRTIFPWPSRFKVRLLTLFGAKVGIGVRIKPQVNIHLPWKLEIGDHAWIGEEVFILNFEQVRLGAHVCVSQRAFICGGNHDFRDPGMRYRNAPITVEDGTWIGAGVFVGPGVTVGCDSVITICSVVTRDLPAGMICGGNPAVPIKPRWKLDD